MLYDKKISLIIPCKNEEAALYSLLHKVPAYIDEVIVIDNNSTDNTVRVARANGVKVIGEKRNICGVGYGFAHQIGMRRAAGDYVIAMDGDDTYPTNVIKNVITYMEKNSLDFVSCNRLPLTNGHTISFFRKFGIQILNFWTSLLYGYYFNDILTGMWVVRKEVIDELQVTSGDWNFSPEIKLAALYNRKIRFSEYHIPYFLRINGKSKLNALKTGIDHFFFILKRRLNVDNELPKFTFRPIATQAVTIIKSVLLLLLLKINK